MTLNDFLNGNFDVNCIVEIYECSDDEYWGDNAPIIVGTGYQVDIDKIAHKSIRYITVNYGTNAIVIEIER